MKAVTLISAVVFIAITVSAMALIYQTGLPVIKRMQATAALDSMTAAFTDLDQTIQRVASEGNGSRRIFDLDSGPGRLSLDPEGDELSWRLDAEGSAVRPRSARYLGNVASGSSLGASMHEGSLGGEPAYVLENGHLRVFIRDIGSSQHYETGTLLMGVYQKDLGEWLPMDWLNISLDGEASSQSGTGYTVPERLGENLPRGKVMAFMDSSYANYSVSFSLESGADFLLIEGNENQI